MKNDRIVIGYKNPIGYYQDIIITRHRHLDDLIIDLNRMIQSCGTTDFKGLSGLNIYALGTINDDTGKMENFDTPEFLTQFPAQIKEE